MRRYPRSAASTALVAAILALAGCAGLILLDKGDELLNSLETEENLKDSYAVTSFNGGSHRFDHMKDACPVIEQFYTVGILGYGLSTD